MRWLLDRAGVVRAGRGRLLFGFGRRGSWGDAEMWLNEILPSHTDNPPKPMIKSPIFNEGRSVSGSVFWCESQLELSVLEYAVCHELSSDIP